MSYIVLLRNPLSRKLLVLEDATDERCAVMEFSSEVGAHSVAQRNAACKAWGYEVINVSVWGGRG